MITQFYRVSEDLWVRDCSFKTSFKERQEGSGGEHQKYLRAGLLEKRISPCLVI